MRPPEPVTIATGMGSPKSGDRVSHRALVGADPAECVLEDLPRVASRAPVAELTEVRAVRNVQGHVAGPFARVGLHIDAVARDVSTQLGRLEQRQADLAPAAGVDGGAVPAVRVLELVDDQVDEVVDVEQVADLLARAAEPDVAQ